MVKLQSNKTNDIPVRELKDGQIGVITRWVPQGGHYGTVIQRHGEALIVIGVSKDEIYWDRITTHDDCRIRILEEGETLVITNNQ